MGGNFLKDIVEEIQALFITLIVIILVSAPFALYGAWKLIELVFFKWKLK